MNQALHLTAASANSSTPRLGSLLTRYQSADRPALHHGPATTRHDSCGRFSTVAVFIDAARRFQDTLSSLSFNNTFFWSTRTMNHTHHNTNTMTSSLRATVLTGAVLLVSFAGPSALQAAVVASYESGITAAGGVSGAADPTGQGWTLSNGDGSNPYAAGFDSGDGGWRTVDGTAMIEAHYTQSLTSGNWTALDSADNWTLSWTIAMDVDAISSSGGNVGDYYINGGSSRQTSITTMVDRDDEFRYWISHAIGASNELLLKDEGSGTTYATGVIVDSGFPNFSTFSMTYDNATGDMELDYGAGTAILTSASADPNTDRLMMGSESVSGQGSAIWNSMSMETYSAPVPRPSVIPEPSTMALLLTGSVLFAAGRARHRA